jgi:hypothetical protein
MKSCLNCRHVADVEEVDEKETQFRCTLPLPPWRDRWYDNRSTLHTSGDGLPSGTVLERGDHMAEHCHFYETAKSPGGSAEPCPPDDLLAALRRMLDDWSEYEDGASEPASFGEARKLLAKLETK